MPCFGSLTRLSGGFGPGIAMRETAHSGPRPHLRLRLGTRLNRARHRRFLREPLVLSVLVIIPPILAAEALPLLRIQRGPLVEQLPATTTHLALRPAVLPATLKARSNRLNAATLE